MKCPKCRFDIVEAGESCPRCGVVFAKVQRAKAAEAAFQRQTVAERNISAAIERPMEETEDARARFEPDPEYAIDEEAYPLARILADVFAFLALFTAIIEGFGLYWFWGFGRQIFSQREMVLFMSSWVVASIASVAVLLAISVGLRMGRDAANHTRAMREYLRRGTGR